MYYNIYATKDYTYHKFHDMIQEKTQCLLKVPQILIQLSQKLDYVTELDPKTVDGIKESAYAETNDNT